MRHFRGVATLGVCVTLGTWGPIAQAVVQTIDATVRSDVLQFLPDGVVNSDTAFEGLDETTSNLPLQAIAKLTEADTNSATLSSAIASTVFSDPRASQTEDPDEFALDMVAFSLDPVVDYEVTGLATETRSITFTSDEIGAADGTELLVTSHFFVDGFMVIWGDLALADRPTSAQLRVRVHQTRPGEDRRVVMETRVNLTHGSEPGPLVTADGALSTDNLAIVDTLGSVLPLGEAYLVFLPATSIPYTYEASVGETFTLDADVECTIENQPYTGAGVVIGFPLDHLLAGIGEAIGEEIDESELLAGMDGAAPQAAKPLQAGKGTSVQVIGRSGYFDPARLLPCGGLGVESLLLPALCPFVLLLLPRRC